MKLRILPQTLTVHGCTVEVGKWISYFIPHFIIGVTTYPYLDINQSMLVKGTPGNLEYSSPPRLNMVIHNNCRLHAMLSVSVNLKSHEFCKHVFVTNYVISIPIRDGYWWYTVYKNALDLYFVLFWYGNVLSHWVIFLRVTSPNIGWQQPWQIWINKSHQSPTPVIKS